MHINGGFVSNVYFSVFFLLTFKKNKILVLSADWLGKEIQEVVCVPSRHRHSLWPRQKPHSHPHVAWKDTFVCCCGDDLLISKVKSAVACLTVIPQPLILLAATRGIGGSCMQAYSLTWRTYTHHPSCRICGKEASSCVSATSDYAPDTKTLNFNAVVWLCWW